MITITEKEFEQLANFVKANYGINLTSKKQTLVEGRLNNVLVENGFKSFSEYYDNLLSDKSGKALTTLIDKLSTNHTFFMREAEHFFYFKEQVLPYLTSTIKDRDMRIWSAGCSSGEEPYTLAMMVSDFFGASRVWWDTKILATDVSTKMLEKAVRGVYPDEQIAVLPEQWKKDYFKRFDGENSIIADKIRREVIFKAFNLMEKVFPFKRKFHVIFCRNVMIYFDYETKVELVRKFCDFTEPGGYLFVGHSESVNWERSGYSYIMPAVYRRG